MKKWGMKAAALVCAGFMALSLAACSKKDAEKTRAGEASSVTAVTKDGTASVPEQTAQTETSGILSAAKTEKAAGRSGGTAKQTAKSAGSTQGAAKKPAENGAVKTGGEAAPEDERVFQDSSNKSVVLRAYKKAAGNSSAVPAHQTITVNSIGSDGMRTPDWLRDQLNSAMKGSGEPLSPGAPGNWTKLAADDLSSASMSVKGSTAAITLNVKSQTDGRSGKWGEGPVGHAMGVMNGFDEVFRLMGAKQAADGTVSLVYKYAQIKVEVDTNTGKIKSGTAKYTLEAQATKVLVKVLSPEAKTLAASINNQIKLG